MIVGLWIFVSILTACHRAVGEIQLKTDALHGALWARERHPVPNGTGRLFSPAIYAMYNVNDLLRVQTLSLSCQLRISNYVMSDYVFELIIITCGG